MAHYTGLASLMSDFNDVAIFRRFRVLNMKTLLHMQAELVHIEEELQEITDEDEVSGDPVRWSYQRDWRAMEDSAVIGGDTFQREKLLEAREKLEKYNSALLTQVQLGSALSPTQQNLDVLKEWLRRPSYGNEFLRGVERRTWDVEIGELASLRTQEADQDALTRWLFRIVPGSFHRRCGHLWKSPVAGRKEAEELFEYKDSTLVRFATSITTFFSTLFPVLSIFALYYVQSMPARLGLIVLFTSLFSVTLLLVSNARRVEIIAATSAFAAVQVVFVGNT